MIHDSEPRTNRARSAKTVGRDYDRKCMRLLLDLPPRLGVLPHRPRDIDSAGGGSARCACVHATQDAAFPLRHAQGGQFAYSARAPRPLKPKSAWGWAGPLAWGLSGPPTGSLSDHAGRGPGPRAWRRSRARWQTQPRAGLAAAAAARRLRPLRALRRDSGLAGAADCCDAREVPVPVATGTRLP